MDYGVWGPETNPLHIHRDRIQVSGFGEGGAIPTWPKREGIILLRGEGYARKITLGQGWLGATKVPRNTSHLTIDASPVMRLASPVLKPDAVQPGKPVVFDESKTVYAPGNRAISLSAFKNARKSSGSIGFDEPSGLSLEVEAPLQVEAGQDLELTYLVGNAGTKTVWVEQSSLMASKVTCEVYTRGRKLAKITGDDLEAVDKLMPSRKPVPLNPGEFLTFRRVFFADEPELRQGLDYGFRFSLKPVWYASKDTKLQNKKASLLHANTVFLVQ